MIIKLVDLFVLIVKKILKFMKNLDIAFKPRIIHKLLPVQINKHTVIFMIPHTDIYLHVNLADMDAMHANLIMIFCKLFVQLVQQDLKQILQAV